jgi:hypothetical protein
VDFATWDGPGGALEPWVNFANATAGGRGGTGDGYIHPDSRNSAPDNVQPSGPTVNPYSLSTTGPAASCELTTGT